MNILINVIFVVWAGWRLVHLDYKKFPTWVYLLDGAVFSFNLAGILLFLFP